MKMKILFLFYLFFELFLCETIPKWQLETKSLDYDENIEIRQGKYSQIFFVLTSLEEDPFSSNINYSYKLTIKDDKIAVLDKEIILNPMEKQAYSTYIGLNCKNSITEDSYTIKLSVTSNNDDTDELSIKYSDINVIISREPITIELGLLFNSMPKNSFNLFKLNEEIYNVDKINIIVSENEDFEFKEIVLEPYGKREELKESEASNHGILFDFPFYKKSNDEKLQATIYEFALSFKNSEFENCFELSSSFSFSIENELPSVNETLKKQILKYNLNDKTPKKEQTNRFNLELLVPASPILIQCSIQGKSFFPEFKSNIDVKYKNLIVDDKIFDFEVRNLEYNSEYFINCELSDTNFIPEERQKINITIGNNYAYDIVHQIKTSREKNRVPHCIKFTFESKENLTEFKTIGKNLCKYIMKKNEPKYIIDLPTIACDIIEEKENIATVCVAPSSKENIDEYTEYDEEYSYENQFNELIEYVKKNYKAKEEKIYNDIEINNQVVKVAMTNKLISLSGATTFYFDVLSTHSQEIQCYYNKNLRNEVNQFLSDETSVILSPNEKKQIQVGIVSNVSDYNIYSLNFKCFNLPNFYYKYESTDYMTMYSYLYIKDKEISQESEFGKAMNITINCKEKKNAKNPLCLKVNKIPINKIIQTELPKFVLLMDAKVEQFSKLTEEAKKAYLINFLETFKKDTMFLEKEKIPKYFQLSTEILKYLSSIDCTKYFNFSDISNEEKDIFKDKNYLECRKIKKEGIEGINFLISNVNHLLDQVTFIISRIGDGDKDENLKRLLIFVKEFSNNEDSYNKSSSEYIIDFSNKLQEQFDDYWPTIENELNINKTSDIYIKKLKKETLLSILEILTNIPRILHFHEIDNLFTEKEKNMTKTGLIINEELIKAQNTILSFSKKFKDYELEEEDKENIDLNFYLSGFGFIGKYKYYQSITARKIEIGQDIIIEIELEYLLKAYKANYLQILAFDSPLVSLDPLEKLNAKEPFSNTLNTFISIQLFDEKGEEKSAEKIPNQYCPKILYLKEKYDFLEGCYYYNEDKQLLEKDNMNPQNDFKLENKIYFKCGPNHLTLFTAGTKDIVDGKLELKNEEVGKGFPTWLILLISFGVVVFLTIIIYIIVECVRSKKVRSSDIDSLEKNDALMKEELY